VVRITAAVLAFVGCGLGVADVAEGVAVAVGYDVIDGVADVEVVPLVVPAHPAPMSATAITATTSRVL
jgi:hypothetical protein